MSTRRGGTGMFRRKVAALITMLLAPAIVSAAPALEEQRRSLLDARRQAEAARRRSEQLERQASGAQAQADRARAQVAAVAARIQQAEADLRAGQSRLAIVTDLQRRQARILAARQAPIARLVGGLQIIARRPPFYALLQPGSLADAVHMRIVLASALPVIQARTAGLRADLRQSQRLRADAELARRALVATRSQLTERRAELARLEAQKRIASRSLRDSAAVEAERALAMGENARDIVDLMDRLEDASVISTALVALPGPMMRPAQPGVAALPVSEVAARPTAFGAYRLPVVGEVESGFGELLDNGVRSRGLTIATQPGATVTAPAQGRVVFAGPFRDYANIVILDHGSGWTSLVTNMRRLTVSVGEMVRPGDPIGVTQPVKSRVTIELRQADRPVDIAGMLR